MKDRRHAIVNVGNLGFRRTDDNREALNYTATRIFPQVPQPGQGYDLVVRPVKIQGLLESADLLPFIVSVNGNDRAIVAEGLAIGGFRIERFNSGIKRAEFSGFFRPPGNEAPAHDRELSFGASPGKVTKWSLWFWARQGPDYQGVLGGGEVVSGFPRLRGFGDPREAEVSGDIFRFSFLDESAAHGII